MELETFDDVCKSIEKNSDRNFHLLLGNGFSIAYDRDIFSYDALHKFITEQQDEDIAAIFRVTKTRNFELIMRQLDTVAALAEVFGGDSKLKDRITTASTKLQKSLLGAVSQLHPKHVFEVPEEQSKTCAAFLRRFLERGKIFSTNYDLLLYWTLLRNGVEHVDGCGRELEDEDAPSHERKWSELRWGKRRETQNVFYLHGALPFFDTGVDIVKEEYDTHQYLLEKITTRMSKGEYPVFVTAGDGNQKLAHIRHNRYLTYCYDTLCSITGSLVTFGFGFGEYDEHILRAIRRAATPHGRRTGNANEPPSLLSVYIGVFSESDVAHIRKIHHRFGCKVHIYDAATVNAWGKSGR